jgi:hypothetical protein
MLTHRSLVGNAHFIGQVIGIEPEDRFLNFSPFYHNGVLVTGILMNSAVVDSTLYFQPRFDPAMALDLIDDRGIGSMFGFGMYAALQNAPNFESMTIPISKALVAATPAQYDEAVTISNGPPLTGRSLTSTPRPRVDHWFRSSMPTTRHRTPEVQ